MKNQDERYISERMEVPAPFENIFSHFYVAINGTAQSVQKRLAPTFQTMMVFSFGSTISLISTQGSTIDIDKVIVLGPVKYIIDYAMQPGADMLVINFKADGFYRFFGHAIISSSLPINPDELISENCFTNLWSSLKPHDTLSRINFILEFSRPYVKKQDATIKQLQDFAHNDSVNAVKALAHETQQSERNIQLKHKKFLGYSAKEIARYERFVKTIEYIERSLSSAKTIDWQQCVEEFGYYDQSHLIHDFKFFVNLSPAQYLKFEQDICIANKA